VNESDTAPTQRAIGSAPAMLLQPSAPPAYCSAAAANSAPRQHQQFRAQRRQHSQLERPEQLGRATIRSGSCNPAGARANKKNQTAPRQLQHGGQHRRAGQRRAPRVTQIAAQRPQNRRFPPAQHEIGRVLCVQRVRRPLPRVSPRVWADVFALTRDGVSRC
jgi:hypothetical protein